MRRLLRDTSSKETMRKAWNAACSAYVQREGWKLVPEFPTAEQQIAGSKAAGGTLAEGFIVGIYKAMLAASPSCEQHEGEK